MALIELKLEPNLKIVDFRSSKHNVKHDLLADPKGVNFPWLKPHQSTPTTTTALPVNKRQIESVSEIFEEDDLLPDDDDDDDNDKGQEKSFSTMLSPIVKEMLDNLEPTSERARLRSLAIDPDELLADKEFIFILFGSCELKSNGTIVQSIIEFWRKFHKKHRFFVIYIEFNPQHENDSRPSLLSVDLNNVDWFSISKTDVKVIFEL